MTTPDLPTYPLTEDGVSQALADLGRSPEDIAARLAELGFKGIRDDERQCVVANYCRAVLHDDDGRASLEDVYAWQGGVWVEWSWTDENGLDKANDHHDWRPSPAFAAFIEKFDKREYPDLIKGASDASAG